MNKNTVRLTFLFVVIILLLGIVLLQNFSRSFSSQNTQHPFKNIKKQEISEILIQGDKDTTKIFKVKDKWILQKEGIDYLADRDRINTVINAFIDLIKEETVSNNKNKHQELGIERKKITLKSKNKMYVLYIGNVSGITKNYVRIDETNEVFVGSGFNDVFSTGDYRDLLVYFIDNEDKVNQIEIAYDNQRLDLMKKNNEWYSGETKVKKERVDFFLSDLKTLKASDIFVKNPIENLYLPESLKITVKEGDKNKSASFYLKDKDYILKTTTSNQFFQIADAYVSSLKKQEKDFVE